MDKDRALNMSPSCYLGQHVVCGGKVKCGCDTRQCDCHCHQGRVLMRSRYLVMAVVSGCISAVSIKDRLSSLDKDTDIAAVVIDSKQCKQVVRPSVCGLANACMTRSMFAGSSCKTANDSAARKDPFDVQYTNDTACKSDLVLAETACRKMKDSHERDLGHGQDGSISSLPRDAGVSGDSSGGTAAHD